MYEKLYSNNEISKQEYLLRLKKLLPIGTVTNDKLVFSARTLGKAIHALERLSEDLLETYSEFQETDLVLDIKGNAKDMWSLAHFLRITYSIIFED